MTKETSSLKHSSLILRTDFFVETLPPLAVHKGTLYEYNGKHYEELDDATLGQYIYDFFKKRSASEYNPTSANSIKYALSFHPLVKKVKEFDADIDGINLNNGVYNFESKKLITHSPSQLFTSCIDVDYDPEQKEAPFFIETLKGIFRNPDGSYDTDTIDNILKLGGYLLYPRNVIPKIFIFYGTGSNGKSIIMEHTYKLFFDKKFISALSLNILSKEESSARKQLLTSRVNFATEQKAGDIESEEVKKIASGESISIERKYQDNITHNPVTKLICSANKFMRFKDTTYGIIRRLFIINFPNKFVPEHEYKLEEEPESRRIFLQSNEEEVVAGIKAEKTAIFNLFLLSLENLRKNNFIFKPSENTNNIFQEYKEESDPTGEWIRDTFAGCSKSEDDRLSLDEIYADYLKWFEYNNTNPKYKIHKRGISSRVKDIFRIKSECVYMQTLRGGKSTRKTSFNLKYKPADEDVQRISDQLNSPPQEKKQEKLIN